MDLECIWVIETAPGSRVELTIKDFDIEPSRTDGCQFDFLRVSFLTSFCAFAILKILQ